MSIEDNIKAEAKRLGFSLAAICSPETPSHFNIYKEWVDAGMHAGMGYLAKPDALLKRAHPELILPGVRSIICLGVAYPNPNLYGGGKKEFSGTIAAYCWDDDYHHHLKGMLIQLIEQISLFSDQLVSNLWYTDTGPILERDFAMQAGLGWIGKNTCLISPRYGSFLFLAEIFTSLELTPEKPFTKDFCGNCRKCIEACPTHCILPNRTIDATRCISYQTIENKGTIPAPIRPLLGHRIFGCDQCQVVCPWNRPRTLSGGNPVHYLNTPTLASPDLLGELSITDEEFHIKYSKSSIKRAHRNGYLRNIAVALGNHRDEKAIPCLEVSLLSEPDPLVRVHVAWAMGQIKHPRVQTILENANRFEKDQDVKNEIMESLENIKK